ncbi:MAG: hypothetical protein PVJ68_13930 [Candidatus Thiodiazotropha sp.]
MIKKAGIKTPALLVLLSIAVTFTALGIFMDGEVLPNSPDIQKPVKASAVQSTHSQRRTKSSDATEPSAVSQQLSRAIEAANQNESDSASRLEARITASQRLIEETNQLFEEKGVSSQAAADSAKRQQFNQQLNELKARLAELRVLE